MIRSKKHILLGLAATRAADTPQTADIKLIYSVQGVHATPLTWDSQTNNTTTYL